MIPVYCMVDDKYVPLYRILWISAVPHFCGEEDCQCEGLYEVRLEADESVWAKGDERDQALKALEEWHLGPEHGHDHDHDHPPEGP